MNKKPQITDIQIITNSETPEKSILIYAPPLYDPFDYLLPEYAERVAWVKNIETSDKNDTPSNTRD